ncbi:MAG: type II toxin-antitoxin system prevent-host-death family antitoxin [Propionibacterium sp.]|nr:type II toxin-antitoxin system prevent-host-death family antitoxin [Propionibacterium sp.]
MDVGIRDLRDGLSKHLDTVRDGHTITVTDHGKPIARIVPIDVPTSFERLVAEGRITLGRRRTSRSAPVTTSGGVSDLVAEQRR